MTDPARPNPARSLWLEEALPQGFEPRPPVAGEERADVCIVGGGYTGLWTALALKELDPAADVALVEADVCGAGASGRNAGFVLSWWAKFGTLAARFGTAEALRLARASAAAIERIGEFCAEHAEDAGFRVGGWLWAATNPAQVGAWRETVETLERLGEAPFQELDGEAASGCSGSEAHLCGVIEPGAAVVQPARLALALRRAAIARGVRVHEGSAMTALEPSRWGMRSVRTVGGRVRAERVVLALNAWAVRFAEVRRRVLVIGSDVLATEPAPHALVSTGWRDGLCVSDSRLLVHYYRATEDGRVVFGKGGGSVGYGGRVGARFDGPSRRRPALELAFRRAYPALAGLRVARTWTGPIDRTRSGLPYFAELGRLPGTLVGVGYSGNGVGPAYVGGRILASMALGRDDEWSRCGLVRVPSERFPPEPARSVGALVVRGAIERKERAEDAGRRPGRVAQGLVRLAPAGLVPTRRG